VNTEDEVEYVAESITAAVEKLRSISALGR